MVIVITIKRQTVKPNPFMKRNLNAAFDKVVSNQMLLKTEQTAAG